MEFSIKMNLMSKVKQLFINLKFIQNENQSILADVESGNYF